MRKKKSVLTYVSALVVAFLMMSTTNVQAQSISDLLKGVAKGVTDKVVGNTLNITGTWQYEGASVELESDNIAKKMAAKVAVASMEKKINTQLEKVGFKAGATTFTFEADSTFTNTTNKKTLQGTYSYDRASEYLTLNYSDRIPLKLKVSGIGNEASFLFEADGILSIITFVGNNSGNSSLKSLSTLLGSYDGLLVGLQMNKQQ